MYGSELQSAEKLAAQGLLSPSELGSIKDSFKNRLFSLHWELRSILFLGISLFTTGISMLVYKNSDSIGHGAIIAFIAMICTGCFYYCFKNRQPYSNEEVKSKTSFFDYVLLLACILLVTLLGYLQYQYTIFGDRYNLATLAPALPLLLFAYFFDNRAVLSLGITGLAASIGLTITPLEMLNSSNFSSFSLILTALVFSLVTWITAHILAGKNVKKHFSFTYSNFAANMALAATLAGLFSDNFKFFFLPLLLFFSWIVYRYSIREKSIYFLLITCLYGYIGLSYLFFYLLFHTFEETFNHSEILFIYSALAYLAATCVLVIRFFRNYRKILNLSE